MCHSKENSGFAFSGISGQPVIITAKRYMLLQIKINAKFVVIQTLAFLLVVFLK